MQGIHTVHMMCQMRLHRNAGIVLFSMLLFLPVQGVLAQSQIVEIPGTNQTIIVSIPTPEVNITMDSTEMERLLTIIEAKQSNDQGYNMGHLLTVSATIISFFSFGLFLLKYTIQKQIYQKISPMFTIIIAYIILIIFIQFLSMVIIISNQFFQIPAENILAYYLLLLSLTFIAILVIGINMIRINMIGDVDDHKNRYTSSVETMSKEVK